jgi:hypothetical protein
MSTMRDLFFITLLNLQTFNTQGPVTIIARNEPNPYFIQGPVTIITRSDPNPYIYRGELYRQQYQWGNPGTSFHSELYRKFYNKSKV